MTGSYLPGSTITIYFQIYSSANSGNTMNFAAGISDVNSMTSGSTDDAKRTNWIADSNGIFGANSWRLDGANQSVTNMSTTDVVGVTAGLSAGASTTVPKNVTLTTRIPMEMGGGTYYMHVIVRETSISGNCNSSVQFDNRGVVAMVIGGSPSYRLSLSLGDNFSDADGSASSQSKLNYRITNYGESGLPNISFKWRFYFGDDGIASWQFNNSIQTAAYLSGGGNYCGYPNDSAQSLSAVSYDCGYSRTANRYFEYQPSTAISAGNGFYLLPPGGGYMVNLGQVYFRPTLGVAVNRGNDYSRLSDLVHSSGNGTNNVTVQEYRFATLYYNGSLVCEYKNASEQDDQSGLEPCSVSACSAPAPTATPTLTPVCATGTTTLYLTNDHGNTRTAYSTYMDLSSSAGSSSRGLFGDLQNSAFTIITYPAMGSAGTYQYYERPGQNWSPAGTTPPASVAKGFGWMSASPLAYDIPAGNWSFSNRFGGQISPAPAVYEDINVFVWDPVTGTDTQLFSISSTADMYSTIGSFSGIFTANPVTTQPAFVGLAGKYLKVEYGIRIVAGGAVAGGSLWMGSNTSNDYVSYPGAACASPTPSPSATYTVTPTPTYTSTPTPTTTPFVCSADTIWDFTLGAQGWVGNGGGSVTTVPTGISVSVGTFSVAGTRSSTLYQDLSNVRFVKIRLLNQSPSTVFVFSAATSLGTAVQGISGVTANDNQFRDLVIDMNGVANWGGVLSTLYVNVTTVINPSVFVVQSVNLVCGLATFTPTPTYTRSITPSPTRSATFSYTSTITPTFSNTSTITPTHSHTSTITLTATPTFSSTNTGMPSFTETVSPTNTPSPSPTNTITPSPTASPSGTPTFTPTQTPCGTDRIVCNGCTGPKYGTLAAAYAAAGPCDWIVLESDIANETLNISKNFAGIRSDSPSTLRTWNSDGSPDTSQINATMNQPFQFRDLIITHSSGGGDIIQVLGWGASATLSFYNVIFNHSSSSGSSCITGNLPTATLALTIDRCQFLGDSADNGLSMSGIGVNCFRIRNSLFKGLSIGLGALASDTTYAGWVEHCTFVNCGKGIRTNQRIALNNCIFAGNTTADVECPVAYVSDYSWSAFERTTSGLGSNNFYGITPTAEFTNAGAGDYSLRVGALSRNSGTSLGLVEDILGAARPQEGTPDRGAYEFVSLASPTYTSTITPSPTFTPTFTQTPDRRMNLEIFDAGQNASNIRIGVRVTNWSTAPIESNRIKIRAWIKNDLPKVIVTQAYASNHSIYDASNTWITSTVPAPTASGLVVAGSDCGGGRTSDIQLEADFSVLPGGWAIPANGGTLRSSSVTLESFYTDSSSWDYSNDYSRITDGGAGDVNRVNEVHYALYLDNQLVCEYTNASTQDALSGQEPCGVSGCVLPTATPSFTATRTPSPSATPTCSVPVQAGVLVPGGAPGTAEVNAIDSGKVVLATSGTLTSLSAYIVNPVGNLRLAVYDSAGVGGAPLNLLAQTGEAACVSNWNNLPVPAVHLDAGTYWIAIKLSDNTAKVGNANSGASTQYYATEAYGVFGNPFSTSAATFWNKSPDVNLTYCQDPPTPTPTRTATGTHSQTATISPTNSHTSTISPTRSHTSTITPSFSRTSTISPSFSHTSTISPTNSHTSTITPTHSYTSTITPTHSYTSTITPTHSYTSTITTTNSHTSTISPTSSHTSTITPTHSHTSTITLTHSHTSSITPTHSHTSTITPTHSHTSTITPTHSHTSTVTPTDSHTSTISPTSSHTSTITPTFSHTSTISPTNSHTATITPTYSHTSTITVTHSYTSTITQTDSHTATISPTPSHTSTITPTHSHTPPFSATDSHTSTISPTSSNTSTVTQTGSHTSTISPTNSHTSTITPTHSHTSTVTPTFSQTSTISPTSSHTSTITSTHSHTSTITPSYSYTSTVTPSYSHTSTITPTSTNTETSTGTITQTHTVTETSTSTATPTFTSTITPTFTSTVTSTFTSTISTTSSETQTSTRSRTPSFTSTLTPTSADTETSTGTITLTSTLTATPTYSSTLTATGSSTSTATASSTSTASPSFTATATASATASATATGSASSTASATGTGTASVSPSSTPSPTFTSTPTSSATMSASSTASSTATRSATSTPSATRTSTGTASATPSITLTASISPTPSTSPTACPACTPVPGVIQVTLRVFDSSGLQLRQIAVGMANSTLAAFDVSSEPYDPSVGPLVLSSGSWSFSFDGRDAEGEVMRNGAYVFELESEQSGSSSKVRRVLQVIGAGAPMVQLLVGPNPLRSGSQRVMIYWVPNVPVDLKVHTLNGELVRDLGRVAAGPYLWDLRGQQGSLVANGVYWVSARRPGERLPQLFKLMLAR